MATKRATKSEDLVFFKSIFERKNEIGIKRYPKIAVGSRVVIGLSPKIDINGMVRYILTVVG